MKHCSINHLLFLSLLLLFSGDLYAFDVCYPDQCDQEDPMEWGTGSSEINTGTGPSVVVSVTRGKGPYTWTVSGTGYYFDQEKTITKLDDAGPTVTVYMGDDACFADISVTDSCDESLKGSLRADGRWVQIGYNERVIPVFTARFTRSGLWWEAVNGKYKTRQQWWGVSGCTPNSGPVPCSNPVLPEAPDTALSFPEKGSPFNQIRECRENGWVVTYENFEDNQVCGQGYHFYRGVYAYPYGSTYEWYCD